MTRFHGRLRAGLLITAAVCGVVLTRSALAQDDEGPIETVDITATKRGIEVSAQSVPIALTALSGVAIEEAAARTLQDLSVASPNVTLADAGTIPGFANFAIRGFGTNSTIPSVEPAVGVFVDGVYLGMSAGVVLDLFDLEEVVILRGPQGLLFGRNTTGGAVLVNTRRPGTMRSVRVRGAYETGPQATVGVSVEGPIGESLSVKLTGFYDDDSGWFTNDFNGTDMGAQELGLIRPMLVWTPVPSFDATIIYERGWSDGDGAVAQNPAYFSGFDLSVDDEGYNEYDWDAFTAEMNHRSPLGLFTNVFGYRRLDQGSSSDIDAQPVRRFQGLNKLKQDQLSNELRYAGRWFDRLDVTAGLFYFTQDYTYIERRVLFGGLIDSTMGAKIDQVNYAAFGLLDFELNAAWSLIAGARYSTEEKTARIATFVPSTAGSRCNFVTEQCNYNFPGPAYPDAPGSEDWDAFTPKLGFEWQRENLLVYGNWARGVRSGGYNVRNTSFVVPPGPYGQEIQDAFELGAKSDWFDGRLRANGAVFYNTIEDLQRDVNLPDPVVGVVQVTRNTADATIRGAELELLGAVTDSLIVSANVGYTDGRYDRVVFDLDGGGIGPSDLGLSIPRLSKWSYQVGGVYTQMWNASMIQLRASYGYRSRAAYSDDNRTYLAPIKDLSASAGVTLPDGRWRFSVYGRNLTNAVTDGVVSALPANLGGGAFRTLNEGRVIGIEANFRY
jgi:iron complex outermembrane receptor protein